jgi:hypothetical protein
MFPYPTELPKKEIEDVISTIMTRNFATNAPNFAKDVWVIAGFALAQTVGELPQTFGVMSSSGLTSLTNDEAIAVLQGVIEASEQPGAVQGLNINWKQVLSWALQLLAQLTAG